MKIIVLAAVAALSAGAAFAQVPDVPLPAGATPAPDCGGRPEVAATAVCVSGVTAEIGAIANAYITAYEALGFKVIAGSDNRLIFARLAGGGCEGVQLEAFSDASGGYIALAPVSPGVIATCS